MKLMICEKEIIKEHNPGRNWIQRTCKVKNEVNKCNYKKHNLALLHFEKWKYNSTILVNKIHEPRAGPRKTDERKQMASIKTLLNIYFSLKKQKNEREL